MDPAKIHQRRWLTLAVLCFSLVVIVLDNTIVNVALPTLVRELHASESELQWIVDAYVLVFAGLLLTAGSLGDRFGRKGALSIGLAVFGTGSALSAFATSANQLIAMRAITGVGGAFIMPSTLSILTNVFTDGRERARAIGIWAGLAGLGVAIGPVTGGYLLRHFFWGSIFLVNLPVVTIGFVAGRFLVPTSKDPAAPRLDPFGAALSIAGLTALVYAIIEAPVHGWTSPSVLGAFAIAALLLASFGAWERHTDHPMLDLGFFSNPRFSAASAAITLAFFAMFGSLFFLTQYLQFVLGYTPLQAGVRLLPMAMTMMIAAPTAPRIVERLGTRRVVAGGLLVVAGAFVLLSRSSVGSGYGFIVIGMMMLAMGMGNTMAPSTESIMGSLPLGKAGVGSAVNDTTRQVGGALGVAVLGSLLSTTYGRHVDRLVQGQHLPPVAVRAVHDGVGRALAASRVIAGPSGRSLALGARIAFVQAMDHSLLAAAGVALLGSIIVMRFLPARAQDHVVALAAAAPDLAPVAPELIGP